MDENLPRQIEEGLERDLQKNVRKAKEFWKNLGPGLTTGASDDDPSGIATYSQTGARYGFQFLWLSLFTFPLMALVQEMCARIGLVTGRGLAANIRLFFPKWVLYLTTALLFFANTLNIGADLGAMAKATQLLEPRLPFGILIFAFAILCLALEIFMNYKDYAKYLKWLAMILLVYVFSALAVDLDWKSVLSSTLVPGMKFTKDQIFIVTAILGTTISPYLFFWQTSQEVEEEILAGKVTLSARRETTGKELSAMQNDVWFGMFLSNLVMFFIIAACGATLYAHGIFEIQTASDAANALRPIAGDKAALLFTLGILGTGLLAVPVLAGSASYALSEAFKWRNGLYRKWYQANAFYGVIIIATLLGVLMNFVGIDPIKALLYSAVANGLVAPVVLVLIVLLSSNKKVMGGRVNGWWSREIGWLTVGIMAIAGVATIVSLSV